MFLDSIFAEKLLKHKNYNVMLKKIFTALNLFTFIAAFSQTGIGTEIPEGALDISFPKNEWGLVLPHVDQAENTKNPTGKNVKKGTIVYDLKENCIKYFNGSEWSGCMSASIPVKLEFGSAVLNQDIITNYPISVGTNVSVPYSNKGETINYVEIAVSSTNVDGLKAILSPGSIKKGAGNLVFSISGTPSTSGDAKFSFSLAGVQCEFVISVKNYTDIKVPPITNLICDEVNQLGYKSLKGKHIINGKEVTVGFKGSNISTGERSGSCNTSTISNSIAIASNYNPGALIITFSRPVTNVGIAFTAAQRDEVVTFTTNGKQGVQLKSTSSCRDQIYIGNDTMVFTSNNNNVVIGGSLTVGGGWFTELKIEHNGQSSGLLSSFCLNGSNAL